MNIYSVSNTLLKLSASFADVSSGLAIDPTTVTAKITLPNGTITDLTGQIIKDAVGTYHVDYLPLVSGSYTYEFIGSGAVEAASINKFGVLLNTF